jgi:uncharacterized membrane protein
VVFGLRTLRANQTPSVTPGVSTLVVFSIMSNFGGKHMLLRIERASTFFVRHLFVPCVVASMLALALLAGRWVLTGVRGPYFLIWNMILAWIPYLAALATAFAVERRGLRPLVPFLGLIWLLFLPNAPYLATDLIHLTWLGADWWYNVGMLLAFAGSGLLLGVAALQTMQLLVLRRYGRLVATAFVLVVSGLCGFGIYLGRFLRWNSWDVFVQPTALIHDLLNLLTNPSMLPQLIGVTGLFAAFMLAGHLTLAHARAG